MVTLKNISEHRPAGFVIDVPEEDAEELLKTGEFKKAIEEKIIVTKKQSPKVKVIEEVKEDFE